jgi:ABC-type antimicrobial peptide transport system permease subunit
MNPEASIRVRTMEQIFSSSTAERRLNFTLLTVFAACALMLALMGIYSVIAYSVAQRNQEIGVRMALGAPARSITGLFMAEGARMIAVGGAVGLAAAAGASGLLRSLLFGIQAGDVTSYVLAGLLLIVVGLLACLLPARRAAQLDPMTTMRES